MKMVRRLTPKLIDELRALRLLSEDEIDTSTEPEIENWAEAKRGAFYTGELEERGYDVRAIANWFVKAYGTAGKSITNLSLNKLVYFAVERALVECRILLTPAKIEAWDHGPVFREIYHSLKGSESKPISRLIERYSIAERKMVPVEDQIANADLEFLKSVFESYKNMSAGQLRNLSHREGGPWHVVWNHRTKTNFGMEIEPGLILAKAPATRPANGRS